MVAQPAARRADLGWAALVCALVLALNASFVWAREGFVHRPRRVGSGDHALYIEMAKGAAGNPDRLLEPPFCWRVLVPSAAGALTRTGLGLNAAFYLLTNLALLGFLLTIYALLRELGFAHVEALLGVALGGLMQGAVRWYEFQYWMTDPAALFLIALSLYLIHRERGAALLGVTVLSALTRETSLLVLPYYFVRLARTRTLREATKRTALLAAVNVGVLVLLRVVIRPPEEDSLLLVAREILAGRAGRFFDSQIYLLTVGSWGVLLPLVLLMPSCALARLRAWPEALLPLLTVYASLALANNTERLLAYALPVVLPFALWSLKAFADAARVPWSALAAVALALQLFCLTRTRLFETGAAIDPPTNFAIVGALVAFWIACRVLLVWRARSTPTAA